MAVSENFISAPAAADRATQRARERRFYIAAAVLFPLLTLIGFARSYYLKFAFDAPPLPSLLVHAHGLIMTAWVLLFTTQIWLVSAKKVKLHMKLGYASLALAVLIAVSGYFAMIAATQRLIDAPLVNGLPPLVFMIIPLTDLVTFAIFYGSAIVLRRRPAEHKRLMLVSAVNFLPPSLGRMQFAAALGPIWFLGAPIAISLAVVAIDRYRTGKFNKVLVAATALFIGSVPLRMAIGNTEAWINFARWLIS